MEGFDFFQKQQSHQKHYLNPLHQEKENDVVYQLKQNEIDIPVYNIFHIMYDFFGR